MVESISLSSHLIASSFSLSSLLGLDLFAQVITLSKDVVCQVVNRVRWANPVHINHALSQHWDDLFHQELAHVQVGRALELLHMPSDRLKTPILKLFKRRFLRFALVFLASFCVCLLSFGVFLLLNELLFTFDVKNAHSRKIVVGAAASLDVDTHAFEHLECVTVALYFEHFCLVLLEETQHG